MINNNKDKKYSCDNCDICNILNNVINKIPVNLLSNKNFDFKNFFIDDLIYETSKFLLEKNNKFITKEEFNILNNIQEDLKDCYIARDKDGVLNLYSEKPYKHKAGYWDVSHEDNILDFYYFEKIFQCVKWSDDDPKTIKDYIEEYKRFKSNNEV